MKFIDLFAGIGGFRRGMELAGHECVGLCEYDKFALASYTAMHLITEDQRKYLQTLPLKKRQKEILKEEYRNGEWYADDIRSVDARSMPGADCWCFGFPCQDISVAGNCLGFAGKRSSLFFAVTSLIRDIPEEDRPSYLIIENVKNLLSVNRGFDFAKLLAELDEIGYDAEWDVLNSKNFGVPQNRERVYIVGHLRGQGTRKVFPLGEKGSIYNQSEADNGDYIVKQIGNCMPTEKRDNPNQGRIYDISGISPCLNKMSGGGREPMIVTAGRIGEHQTDLVQDCEGISRSLKATDYKNPQKIQVPISMTNRLFHQTDMSPTLTASGPSKGRGNNSPVPGVLIREATKKGYAIAGIGDSINLNHPNSKTRRGRVGKGMANTLDTGCNQGVINHYLVHQFFRNCLDHINSYAVTGLLVQLAVTIDRLGLFEIVICPSLKPEALPWSQASNSEFIT